MTIHYTDDAVTLWHGDCIEVMRQLPDASVDAVVTDPPYGLEFMGKAWDSFSDDPVSKSWDTRGRTMTDAPSEVGKPKTHIKDNPRCRLCGRAVNGRDTAKGFKVCHCEQPDIYAPSTSSRKFQAWSELWATEALRVLKPGGHLLAFGGTRTWHRLAVAIEDAGFEVRDNVAYLHDGGLPGPMCWAYGSGFPKSLDVAKAIAKSHGDDSPLAQQWQGWGTALKPAFEPVVVARKPLVGTVAANVERYGTGALNIDGCRIGMGDEYDPTKVQRQQRSDGDVQFASAGLIGSEVPTYNPAGRWPANVILDESQAAELDRQSGERPGSQRVAKGDYINKGKLDGHLRGTGNKAGEARGFDDTGGASRFFYTAKADSSQRPRVDGVAHPTVKPLDLMRYLVRLVTPPGGVVLEPFAGSGTTLEACIVEGFRCIGIEREADYIPLIMARITKPIEVTLL